MKRILIVLGGGSWGGNNCGCGYGDTNGKPNIANTGHLEAAYQFGRSV